MSIKSLGIGILIFVGSIMMAYMIQLQLNGNPLDPSLSKRAPSSVNSVQHHQSLKQELLNSKDKGFEHVHTEKLKGPVEIALEDLHPGAKADHEVFTLRFSVKSSEDMDFLDYQWSLPENVILISGATTGRFENLVANEVQFVEATFQTLNADNQQIHAHISKDLGSMQFGDVAQFNTVLEEYLNPKADKHERLKNENESGSTDSFFKIFE